MPTTTQAEPDELAEKLREIEARGHESIDETRSYFARFALDVSRILAKGEALLTDEDLEGAYHACKLYDGPGEAQAAAIEMYLLLVPDEREAAQRLMKTVRPDDPAAPYGESAWQVSVPAPYSEYGRDDEIRIVWTGGNIAVGGWRVARSSSRHGVGLKECFHPILRQALEDVVCAPGWTKRVSSEIIARVLKEVER